MSTTAPTLLEKLETEGHDAFNQIEHGVVWLAGMLVKSQQAFDDLENSSPLVKMAIEAGEASLTARGIPVQQIANAGELIIQGVEAFANSLSSPPPVPVAAVAAAATAATP